MKPALHREIPTELAWHDEFDGDLSLWDQPDFVGSPHRTGNKYLNLDGSIDESADWSSVPGRYAALYNDHRDKCQFIRDGVLVMKGYAVNEPNLYRNNFTDSNGVVHPYGDNLLYTAWLSALETINKGSVVEVRVSVENMVMREHRWNAWFMPTDGKAYQETVRYAEIDNPELTNPSRVLSNGWGDRAIMKIVGGLAGDTTQDMDDNGNYLPYVNLLKRGIDLRKGWHTFTTVWNHDGTLELLCDGILCNSDDRNVLMQAEFIVAREMNSGVKNLSQGAAKIFNAQPEVEAAIQQFNIGVGRDPKAAIDTPGLFTAFIADQDSGTVGGKRAIELAQKVLKPWENYSTGPKMPADSGLTGLSVIEDLDLIDQDEVLVDYVRVYKILEGESPKVDDPDVDVGDPVNIDDLTIDEKIAILASQYERAEAKIAEQAEYIVTLAQAAKDANDLAGSKIAELAAYREQTTATINRLKQTENELRAELDTLKKKPVPAPTPVAVVPPVSKKSVDRLNALLRIAGR